MSLQTIIDTASQIQFERGRIISATISRSQRIKTATRNATQPWGFTITPAGSYRWSTSRDWVEAIEYADRDTEYEIRLANNTKMSYLVKYQGELAQGQLDTITINTFTNYTMTLQNLPSIGASLPSGDTVTTSTVLFRIGDYIQPANSRYPYTIIDTVYRGSGSTVNVAVNRPFITSEAINPVGQNINVGVDCSWRVIVLTKPAYQAVPYDRMTYNGDFKIIEKII